MKKIIAIAICLCGFTVFSAHSQTVNDVPLNEIDVEYIQIVGTSKFLSSKVIVQIDFGQRTKLFSTGKATVLKDDQGKTLDFNSMVDALNFLADHGFEFINAYAYALNNQSVYHYLMKKKRE